MTDDLGVRARAIFLELSTLRGPAIGAELDRLVGGDAELRAAVVGLLDACNRADEAGLMAGVTRAPPVEALPGTVIGPYKVLQLIGEGGFGSVFLAEQSEPVRRRVAIKIIKLGMDSKQVIARFEAERQALALMDHPHIARVFDGGTTESGRPYFVMEYVVGDAITRFADAYKLDIPARLALFAQVCSAVQHAHTKGVIHRDLKPANVLVFMVDGKPFAKVIDFGIAKATASPLTDKTLFTEHRQLIGTPEYMSPEQANGSPDLDTRTDVYALGVLLYELLTGVTPFDAARLRSAAWAEMQRIIREEEPPIPSLRLSRDLRAIAQTAACRRVEPPKLATAIRGDLDWIVMKALDKDRSRRYATPAQFAEDIGHHLAGEPVVAAPPSGAYRLKKFARKHKGPLVTAAVVVVALLAGITATTAAMISAERNYTMAVDNAAEARESRDVAERNAEAARRANEELQAKQAALAAQTRAAQHDANISRSLYYQQLGLLALAFEHAERAYANGQTWTAGLQLNLLAEQSASQWRLYDSIPSAERPTAMAVVPGRESDRLVVAHPRELVFFDLESGAAAGRVPVPGSVREMHTVPKHDGFVLVLRARAIDLVDTRRAAVVASWDAGQPIDAFDVGTKRIALTTRDLAAHVLTMDLQPIARTPWPEEAARNEEFNLGSIAISPDGKTVVFSTMGLSDERAVWRPDEGTVRIAPAWMNTYWFFDNEEVLGAAMELNTEGLALHRFRLIDGAFESVEVLADIPLEHLGNGRVGSFSRREVVYVGAIGVAIADLTSKWDVRARVRTVRYDTLLLRHNQAVLAPCVSDDGRLLALSDGAMIHVYRRTPDDWRNEGARPLYTGDRILRASRHSRSARVHDITDPTRPPVPVGVCRFDESVADRHTYLFAHAASWDGRTHAVRLADMTNDNRYTNQPINHRILVYPAGREREGGGPASVRIPQAEPYSRGAISQITGSVLEFSVDGSVLLVATGSTYLRLDTNAYDTATGEAVPGWPDGPPVTRQITAVPGLDLFIDVSEDDLTCRIRDLKTGRVLRTIDVPDRVHAVACGNPAGRVAIKSYDDVLRVFDARTGERIRQLSTPLLPAAWSPADDVFVAETSGGSHAARQLVLASAEDAAVLGVLQIRHGRSRVVMFSSDGSSILHPSDTGVTAADYFISRNATPRQALRRVRTAERDGETWQPPAAEDAPRTASASLKDAVGSIVALTGRIVRVMPTRTGGHVTLFLDDEATGVLVFVRQAYIDELLRQSGYTALDQLTGESVVIRGPLEYYGGYTSSLVGRLQITWDGSTTIARDGTAAPSD